MSPTAIPTANPIDDEIKRAHVGLSPEAQQAVSMAIGGNVAPPQLPAVPRIPIPATSAPSPSAPRIQLPEAPGMAPAKAEVNRLTIPTIDPATGKPARDSQNQSGIDQIKHAGLRIPLQVLDAIGSGLFPQIAMGIPGTAAHHNLVANRALVAENQQEAEANDAAKRAAESATAEHALASADQLRHPAPEEKPIGTTTTANGKVMQFNPETDRYDIEVGSAEKAEHEGLVKDAEDRIVGWTDGQGKHHDMSDAPPAIKAIAAAAKPKVKQPSTIVEKAIADNPNITAEQLVELTAKAQKEQQWTPKDAAFLRAAGGDPDDPKTQTPEVMKKFRDLVTEKTVIPTDHGQNFVDPESGRLVRVEPGQAVPKGGMTAQQAGSVNTPTMQMRNVAAQAGLVHEQTPHMLSEIDRLKDKLGPAMGRWNEFMQGKVGANDPDMAGLRADLMMYSSAVALMHARGRLPENLREEFDRAINAPKQSPENLKAIISRIDDWTAKNMQAMGGRAAGSESSVPTVKTKEEYDKLPSGAVYMEDGKKFKKP